MELNFKIDKLTNSIENTISEEIFQTELLLVKDFKNITFRDWLFDWKTEISDQSRMVFKLTTINNPSITHGLICLTDKGDHIFMDLIENAKFNRGKKKLYRGVAGNMVAFACKLSFEKKYDGIVSFIAKSKLIEYYKESLGAKLFGNNRMYIDTKESFLLKSKYFK